jgi:hypothetical protein
MTKFEDPINFETTKTYKSFKLTYENLMELSQGSPVVGDVYINEKKISSKKFGGPAIFANEFLFIPMYIRNFWNSGFKFARINLTNYNIDICGNIHDLILLDKIENDVIYYYDSFEKTNLKKYEFI